MLKTDYQKHSSEHWHRILERKPTPLLILSLVVILIGGVGRTWFLTFLVKVKYSYYYLVCKPYTPLRITR
jgi:cytochrome c oxidase cbb3-type subunit I/II